MNEFLQQYEELRSNFYLISPEYLFFFYGVPVLIITALAVVGYRFYKRPVWTFGSNYPLLGPIRFWLMMIVVFALAVAALVRPAIAKNGLMPVAGPVEVIFMVDVSFSQFAQDWGPSHPSRLEIARREILNLFSSNLLKSGDKASLYIFANGSKRPMPLVDFNRHADKFIGRASSLLTPPKTIIEGEFYLGYSDIAVALEDVYQTLDSHEQQLSGSSNWRPTAKSNRLAVIFTDGDFELNSSVDSPEEQEKSAQYLKRITAALQEYRKRGIKIYAVVVGTRRGVQLTDILKKYKLNNDYSEKDQKDLAEKGLTRVYPENLRRLAVGTGGNPVSDVFLIDEFDVSAAGFLMSAISSHRSFKIEPVVQESNQELWPWFLMASLIFFGLGWLIK